jgi:hypothetical protein
MKTVFCKKILFLVFFFGGFSGLWMREKRMRKNTLVGYDEMNEYE